MSTSSVSTDMLVTFVKVAEHLGVSAAAADLDISKSVVSKRVAQLEQAVQATLFARSTRRIALTPAGETYLDFARQALLALGNADESLRDLRQSLSGQIRITAPGSWGQKVLAGLMPAFLARHPAIEVELLLDDRLMDIAYERIDIALRMTAVAAPDLRVTPVARLDWVICAAPLHLANIGMPSAPQDLMAHPCMSYWRESSDDSWQLVQGDTVQRVRVHSRYHANNADAVASAAVAGLGVALLPLYVCAEDLAAGRLVRLLPDWTPVTKFGNSVNAVATPERMQLTRNRVLLDYLRLQLG
jgi:DNA-binding transcriptional LysR family regulator